MSLRPGNDLLGAELYPARHVFLSEENIAGLLDVLKLPNAVDSAAPLQPSQIMMDAAAVYDMDSDGRAAESGCVCLQGSDPAQVQLLVDRWNAQLARRLLERWDTDYGPHVSYAYGYDVTKFADARQAALTDDGQVAGTWGTDKRGRYADGAGGFIDSRDVQYTSNRLKGRPLEAWRFLSDDRPLTQKDYVDYATKPTVADWEALM